MRLDLRLVLKPPHRQAKEGHRHQRPHRRQVERPRQPRLLPRELRKRFRLLQKVNNPSSQSSQSPLGRGRQASAQFYFSLDQLQEPMAVLENTAKPDRQHGR